MKITCNLQFHYDDSKKAEKVIRSLKVDDLDFVDSKVNGDLLEVVIESSSIPSLIHTLDDYLACLSVAEKIIDKN
jgi:hypothetical protein